MIAELGAALAAASWGAADYFGGRASRGADSRAVMIVSQAAGVPLLAAGLAVTGAAWPGWPAIGWGFAAGLSGACGLVLLYRGLASGANSVVAPVTGVTAAVLPLAVGLAIDRSPGVPALIGLGCALVAIGLVSVGPADASQGRPGTGRSTRRAGLIGQSLLAGAAFGLFYTLLSRAPAGAGLWPVAGVRAASLVAGAAFAGQARFSLRLDRRALFWALATGAGDVAANALYLAAAYAGALSVVAPIASLHPVVTVLLAVVVGRETVRPAQVAGLALAASALVLVHIGAAT